MAHAHVGARLVHQPGSSERAVHALANKGAIDLNFEEEAYECILVVGVVEALVPEEGHEAPVAKTRHARRLRRAGKLVGGLVLRLADGDDHVIRRAGELVGGRAREYDGGIHHW